MYRLGAALRHVAAIAARALRGFFVFVGVLCVIALAVLWGGTLIGAFFLAPLISFLAPVVSWLPALAFVSLLIFIGVPLFFLVMWLMRIMFDTRIHGGLAATLTLAWIFSIAGLASAGWLTASAFHDEARLTLHQRSAQPTTDTLQLELGSWPEGSRGLLRFGIQDELSYRDGNLYLGQVAIALKPSPDDSVRVVVEAEARGDDRATARAHARSVDYPFELYPDKVVLSPWFRLNAGHTWRAQQLHVAVYVPVGKYVRIRAPQDGTCRPIRLFSPTGDRQTIWPCSRPTTWQMGGKAAREEAPPPARKEPLTGEL